MTMVNYTKPELEITEFEIVDVLTVSLFAGSGNDNWDEGWY